MKLFRYLVVLLTLTLFTTVALADGSAVQKSVRWNAVTHMQAKAKKEKKPHKCHFHCKKHKKEQPPPANN